MLQLQPCDSATEMALLSQSQVLFRCCPQLAQKCFKGKQLSLLGLDDDS